MSNTELKERVYNGSLFSLWFLWECPQCGKRIQSAGKPASMWWMDDHKCSFLQLDRFGNFVHQTKSVDEAMDEMIEVLDGMIEKI